MKFTRRFIAASALLIADLAAAQTVPASQPSPAVTPAVVPAPAPPMTFFITSVTPTQTGNLGGLAGADRTCQQLAEAVGAGHRTWHAYLSTQATPPEGRYIGEIAVNARDRIGTGPWHNAKGVLIAANVEDLHGDVQRDRNNIQPRTALTEKGDPHPAGTHDVLTGSDSHGRAFPFPVGVDMTCNNWTSDGPGNKAMVGHTDRSGGSNTSWNSAHMSKDCTRTGLIEYAGAGHFYCFAID